MFKGKLIACGTNAKTIKGDGEEFLTAIMYLAPFTNVPGFNACSMAKLASCDKACLFKAGRGAFTNVEAARIRKTVLFRDDRKRFMEILVSDLEKFVRYAAKKTVIPCVRPNGTSDILWECIACERDGVEYRNIMEAFPEVQFYDYTKIAKRFNTPLPDNYSLTLSYSEANDKYVDYIAPHIYGTDNNVAVVFRDKATLARYMQSGFLDRPVIDGDKTDLRFTDPAGVVVGLYAKGPARKDDTGFVID